MENGIVSLTFDDGWSSQYDNALEVLDEFGFKGTFYIITKYLKTKNPEHMTPEQVLSLHEQGHEIGSHTITHPSLPFYFWKDKMVELRDSKKALESLTEDEVKSFAYPYGRYNEEIIAFVKEAGYQNARAVKGGFSKNFPGLNWGHTSPYEICCKSVERSTTLQEVVGWVNDAQRERLWLVLNFHQIQDDPYRWGCTKEMFRVVCDFIKRSKLPVIKLTDAEELFLLKEEKVN